MKIVANIAAIREDEVTKMREKVKAMQDLLASRKKKLQVLEEPPYQHLRKTTVQTSSGAAQSWM